MASLFLVQFLATLPAVVGIQRMCNYSNGLLKCLIAQIWS
jgi:hypothetical protein